MSLKALPIPPVPEETAHVARAHRPHIEDRCAANLIKRQAHYNTNAASSRFSCLEAAIPVPPQGRALVRSAGLAASEQASLPSLTRHR
jgi:hypothetical protein